MKDIILDSHLGCPTKISQLELIVDMVTEVARHISGVTGPVGMDSMCLQNWILQFEEANG